MALQLFILNYIEILLFRAMVDICDEDTYDWEFWNEMKMHTMD